jgi:hypothetical protein
MSYQLQGAVLEFKDGITTFRIQKNHLSFLPIMIGFENGTPDLGGGRLVAYDVKFEGNALNQASPTIVEKAKISTFDYSIIPSGGISYIIPFIFDAIEFVIENPTTDPEFNIYLGGGSSTFFVESL